MIYSKKAILTAMSFCVVFVPVSRGETNDVLSGRELLRAVRERDKGAKRPAGETRSARTAADTNHPSASDLLKRYSETQDKLTTSFISKAETDVTWTGFDPVKPNIKRGVQYENFTKTELRSGGSRCYTLTKRWGDNPGRASTNEEKANYVTTLWDGNSRYQYSPGRLILTPKHMVSAPPMNSVNLADGGPFRGFFYGTDERIDSELGQAGRISGQPAMENVGGSQCYVVNAIAKGSEYTIWIDPEHDYHLARAVVKRHWASANRPEHYRGRKVTGEIEGNSETVLENVRFKKVDGLWVPVECDYYLNTNGVKGSYSRAHYHHKVTEYQLNPDHEALGSFKPDFIRNGAHVYLSGVKGITYTWQNGKVVDDEGKEVEPNSPLERGMAGRRLPDLKKLGIEVDANETKGKMILVFFWDMEQKASQRLVTELVRKAEELRRKDVVVAGAPSSKADANSVARWVNKNGVHFPVGKPKIGRKRMHVDWGIRKVPWLILTDKEHIVRAEGFGLEELDEKIKESEGVKH